MRVCLFVEGGGPQRKTQTSCRKAFRLLLEKVLGDRPKPRIVASGSRDEAYYDFCRSVENNPDTFPVLLVDSEDPVAAGATASAHLRNRERHWDRAMPDEQAYLMVQCMEAWFLADIPALQRYYEQHFRAATLPGNPDIEAIPKGDVLDGLDRATAATSKGPYHKTKHGFDILARIDPQAVRKRSRHAEALFTFLLATLRD